jgi:hypothetical protein
MRYAAILLVLSLAESARADAFSKGPKGIRSSGLSLPNNFLLTGNGVGVGQVEPGRAADPTLDTALADHNDAVHPTKTFVHGQAANAPGYLVHEADGHATAVASIIIAHAEQGADYVGVAPGATFYSTSFKPTSPSDPFKVVMVASVALLDQDVPVRVINMSFVSKPDGYANDGNHPLTQFVDWSAAKHDVLYVTAMSPTYTTQGYVSPSDNFNGITVGSSWQGGFGDHYYKASPTNRTDDDYDAVGPRASIDLLAPGDNFDALYPGQQKILAQDSISFATAHVTGAAALLHEYAEYQIQHAGWDPQVSHRHELMKAVLLNSADKGIDIHGSTRTIENLSGDDWSYSPAATDPTISLDPDLGAGHLNTTAALTQLAAGRYEWPSTTVPNIGWDYGTVAFGGADKEYVFQDELQAGDWVAVTLTWDRMVEAIDPNDSYLDGFFPYQNIDQVLNDLDLYLTPAGEEEPISTVYDSSYSSEDNVEHIFFHVEEAGAYQVVVNHFGGYGTPQDYAIAWWAGEPVTGPPEDFDGDGDVDGADLEEWRTAFGVNAGADADADGDSDGTDFLAWQRNLGASTVPVGAPVPEPGMSLLCCLALPLLILRRRK